MLTAILALTGLLAAVVPAAAHPGRYPVPSCGWASVKLIGATVGEPVRADRPQWSTHFAPVLTCGYRERSPKLQLGNVDLLEIRFSENTYFNPGHAGGSWMKVKHLGSCVASTSCLKRGGTAWIGADHSVANPGPYGVPYDSVLVLHVEDGLNNLTIAVGDPQGPLPVHNEVAAFEKLARHLLPKFYWH